jgi:polysaccharide chain length determinant protein (PEP-CTERM system associated)
MPMTVPDTFEDFLRLLWNRKLWLLVPTLLGAAASLVALLLIPPTYRASTMILVESQKIPTDYVRPTVTTSVRERLATIEQQITNRENLERIIKEMGLYQKELAELGSEKTLQIARRDLELEVKGDSIFRIYFSSGDPVKAADTANRIAVLFIQENLKRRADEARNTSSFLEGELSSVMQDLEEQEQIVAQFRLRNAGSLPDDREGNLRAIDQLQRRLEINMESIDRAELRTLVLERSVEQLRRDQPTMEIAVQASRLEKAREELLQLRSQYTDEHPDVIRLRREIESLEGEETPRQRSDSSTDRVENRELKAQLAELASAELELQRQQQDQKEIVTTLRRYQAKLEEIPKVEQELLQLTRDYDLLQANYDSLMAKRIQAKLSENLEQQKQSEQFTILERAIPPASPFKPNRLIVLLVGLGLGGGLGLGVALLREQLDQTFRDAASLQAAFPLVPVLGVIHRIDPGKRVTADLQEEEEKTA